jgi:hypothetical protein
MTAAAMHEMRNVRMLVVPFAAWTIELSTSFRRYQAVNHQICIKLPPGGIRRDAIAQPPSHGPEHFDQRKLDLTLKSAYSGN